jgi:hypothetical protein
VANESKIGIRGNDESELERLRERIELIDDRMDNIDSVLTAVAERIMKQPISIILTCPHCNKNIEVALVGQQKPT